MNPLEKEFDLIGTFSNKDCQYIEIENYKINRHILKNLAGTRLRVVVSPYKETRSDRQNRYFWGVIIVNIAAWLFDSTGRKFDKDEVYAWVKTKLLGIKPEVRIVMQEEVLVFREVSFSKMNTKEFADTTNLIIDEMAIRGCDIPLPTTNNELHEFIERDLSGYRPTDHILLKLFDFDLQVKETLSDNKVDGRLIYKGEPINRAAYSRIVKWFNSGEEVTCEYVMPDRSKGNYVAVQVLTYHKSRTEIEFIFKDKR